MNEIIYIPKLRKNLIFIGTLLTNGFSYRSDGDRDIMKVSKGALTVMGAKKTTSNMYKLLGNIIVCDVASVQSTNDVTKLWLM